MFAEESLHAIVIDGHSMRHFMFFSFKFYHIYEVMFISHLCVFQTFKYKVWWCV